MKKITEEEKAAMLTRPLRKQGLVRTMLLRMKVGDIILIEPHEWTWTSATPGYLCRRVEAKTTMKFEVEKVLPPEAGWIVTRVA